MFGCAFDSHLLTTWLIGLPSLQARLNLRAHAALRSRIIAPNTLNPHSRDDFKDMIRHALKTAGAKPNLLTEPAYEVLYRVSRALPRHASKLLRISLQLAHFKNLDLVDENLILTACDELQLDRATTTVSSARA